MKQYIGHHTCSMGGGFKYVSEKAPFLSSWPKDEDDPRQPYLGEGYYFWEYDIVMAKAWGKMFYTGWYYIIEANINTTEENFLDLVGDKKAIGHFLLTIKKLVADKTLEITQPIGEIIEYLKKANKIKPGLFPYTIIRAEDYKRSIRTEKFYFKKTVGGYTYLEPNLIFCLIEINNVILTNKKIIFQSQI